MGNASGHSKIGASSMKRWRACPGSVRMSEGMHSQTSIHAAEGTAAHEQVEFCLREDFPPSDLDPGNVRFVEGHEIEVTQDMIEAIQVYYEHVKEIMSHCDKHGLEVGFHLAELHDDLWGTTDFVGVDREAEVLYVRDYKHGSGVVVEVEDNPQLLYYAVGAALDSRFTGFKEVDIGIVQPRAYHDEGPIRSLRISAAELMEFAEDLVEAAKATEDPNAPLVPNSECKWCPAAGACPELSKQAQGAAKQEFSPNNYDPKLLAEALDKIPMIEAWIKGVRSLSYNEALAGRVVPGKKLVKKTGNRAYIDEELAANTFKDAGLGDDDIYEPTDPKLKSPAQMEKFIGKKEFKAFSDLVEKPDRGFALVDESDKRPAVQAGPQADFSAV